MKVAVVGSNRGIGLALVEELLKQDHEVFAFCRRPSPDLKSLKPTMIISDFDVTDEIKTSEILKNQDLPPLDCLLHVSGIMRSTSLQDLDIPTMMEQFEVNSVAPIACSKAFLPYLSDNAKIGLLTSRMGSIADNTSGGSYGYRMSKAALNAAGKSLALDLKERGLAVFLLHPGWVQTDMTNQTGHVTPNESALGLIKVMESKTIEETGTFWHMNGEGLPW